MKQLIIAVLLIIAGCDGSRDNRQIIRFWQFWADINTKPAVEAMIAEFEEQNPDVKVQLTDLTWANGHDKLVISFAANYPPDIMELGSDWIAEFASNNLLAKLESDLPENYLYPAMWDSSLYALPWLLDSRILYFNLDLLKKVNMEIPANWDELLAACAAIDSLGDDYFGFGCNSAEKHRLYKKFLPFLWSNGGTVLSDDGSSSGLGSDEAVEALEFYLDLCDCGAIESQRRLEEYFREGKLGFVISGGWLLKRLRATPPDFDYRLVPFFTPDGQSGTSFFGGEYIAVSAGSANIESVKKLASFLISKTNSQKLCDAAGFGFPAYSDLEIDDPEKNIEALQLANSRSTPPTPLWVNIEQDIEDALEAAIYRHGSPAIILRKASGAIDDKLKSAENEN